MPCLSQNHRIAEIKLAVVANTQARVTRMVIAMAVAMVAGIMVEIIVAIVAAN